MGIFEILSLLGTLLKIVMERKDKALPEGSEEKLGFDLSSIDWPKLFAAIMALIQALSSKPQAVEASLEPDTKMTLEKAGFNFSDINWDQILTILESIIHEIHQLIGEGPKAEPELDAMSLEERAFKWQPSPPDHRDFQFADHPCIAAEPFEIKTAVDLRDKLPVPWDQKNLGACTTFGVSTALVYDDVLQGHSVVDPSKLFMYFNARTIEGTIYSDAGAYIRDVVKCVAKYGYAPEADWPYVPAKFKFRPPLKAYKDALKNKALQYHAVNNSDLIELKTALSSGFPVVFGATLYRSFYNVGADGIVSLPTKTEGKLGGHCMTIVGYDDARGVFIVRNSWGPNWGDHGYCYFPYAYLTNLSLATDFWVISQVS
jgi:C1A family cysteine protease